MKMVKSCETWPGDVMHWDSTELIFTHTYMLNTRDATAQNFRDAIHIAISGSQSTVQYITILIMVNDS